MGRLFGPRGARKKVKFLTIGSDCIHIHICIFTSCTFTISIALTLCPFVAYMLVIIIIPYSRVVTPPLLKRNFALKRGGGGGGGRNNENCIYLCVFTPPLPTQQVAVIVLYHTYAAFEQANTFSKDSNVVTT